MLNYLCIAISCFIFYILLITFFPISLWSKPVILTGSAHHERGGEPVRKVDALLPPSNSDMGIWNGAWASVFLTRTQVIQIYLKIV